MKNNYHSFYSLATEDRIFAATYFLMLRSHFGQHVVHGFESAQIKLGFEAKVADA